MSTNKRKVFNDPIYGFVTIPYPILFDLIEHRYFQRLRRITQMGLSYLVYPGAHHTRFHHAIGAMHLMQKAVGTLRQKKTDISEAEEKALYIAILLHDIGHGPFSHALENSIVTGVTHEELSLRLMEELNVEFTGELDLAIAIFTGKYPRKFMLQLISSQLDMDRMDYLKRDSFYSGVAEGNINSDRLIQMMQVVDDTLVIEEKGIYSVEKFLVARRLMYWQTYLHKTSVAAEHTLIKILQRAKELVQQGVDVPCNAYLAYFLFHKISLQNCDTGVLEKFTQLDDTDIISALKQWQFSEDEVLSRLSKSILNRELLKIKLSKVEGMDDECENLIFLFKKKHPELQSYVNYFIFTGILKNQTYEAEKNPINILLKDNSIVKADVILDVLSTKPFNKPMYMYYVCYPKDLV